MVSGNAEIINTIKPLLNDAGAVNIWEYGDGIGNSNVAKLCTNYMIQAALQSMSEGISFAKKTRC
jgi:3-hydroxyisobutyrate dehydrogenase-like beta-hydroxyacid dehydrogenase